MPHDSDEPASVHRFNFRRKAGGLPAGSAAVIGVILAFFALIMLVGGFFIVSPAEQAVILRFGAFYRTIGPGPHWFAPFVYSRSVVNIQRIDSFPYQSQMLTEDENIVSVALAVQYRVNDPEAYLFNVIGPRNTLMQATSSALRQVVGQMTLNEILTTGREALRNQVAKQLNKTMSLYHSGLIVMDVTLQATKPPQEVSSAFDDAVKAREDSQRYKNKANAYARQIQLSTQGRISRVEQDAQAYYQTVTLKAQGEVARYKALLKAYLQSPVVTKTRLYLNAMDVILPRTSNIIVSDGTHNLTYLPIKQLLDRRAAAQDQGHANEGDGQ